MNNSGKPNVLIVDDDQDTLTSAEHLLVKRGYEVATAASTLEGLKAVRTQKPDIILLDGIMPERISYEFCSRLQEDDETAYIPVIFVTAPGEEKDMARAFSVGAVDYLVKPIREDALIQKVESHLQKSLRWKEVSKGSLEKTAGAIGFDFSEFKRFLSDRFNLASDAASQLARIDYSEIYSIPDKIEISNEEIAQCIADFLKLPYVPHIDPEDVELGALPSAFCRANLVIPVKEHDASRAFVLSNPLNLELMDTLEKLRPKDTSLKLTITQPESIKALLRTEAGDDRVRSIVESTIDEDRIDPSSAPDITWSEDEDEDAISETPEDTLVVEPSPEEIDRSPVNYIANNILHSAVSMRASDIHIEPKRTETVVRFRIDGDMRDMFTLKKKTAWRLVSKLKVLGRLDIAEKRRPQDGSLEAIIDNKAFKLRLATTSTPDGESMIVRLLYLHAKPKGLGELGMTDEQNRIMTDATSQNHGLILVVGATGSGKTTTIYSLLSQIDCKSRSLISIEDPVEYRIPHANQQQVNEKAGVSFESLLKSVVRQDPDMIFLGEIRDQYSARMAMDFASTGHLTVTTLHTTNATTAIFRLERLGITRSVMADAILCIIAQKLLKKVCPYCRRVSEPSPEEIDMLSPFVNQVPPRVANPAGCPRCANTGYLGREAVYEVFRFDDEISSMVRSDTEISQIRNTIREKSGYLISDHAVEKVRNLLFSPKDVYTKALLEEMRLVGHATTRKEDSSVTVKERKGTSDERPSILVVDDDSDIQSLIKVFLENDGYNVISAKDGIDALLYLASQKYDLIISDVNMPNLDGFKLVEMMNQKGIQTPVIFLTSCTDVEDEIKGLELGAIDYIKKPLQKEILLMRIRNFFGKVGKKRSSSAREVSDHSLDSDLTGG